MASNPACDFPFRILIIVALLISELTAQQPARNLFRTTVLLNNLSNPTQICFRPDGRLYLLSKGGSIRLYDPKTGDNAAAANLTVSNVREDGLHGIALDPGFADNRHLYLLFGTLSPSPANVVARFTAKATGEIDVATRKDILTFPYSMGSSDEHNTGNLAMAANGDLYVALGDNTNNFFSGPTLGFSPRDPARPNYDAQRSAANSNDLRGKILRIHPLPFADTDSPVPGAGFTYSIPAGNLFAAGMAKTRPEIYVMGCRHPFRITVDAKTGWLFWAEPGPNATADDPNQGPRGYDEVNIAKSPGNYGWPYCAGDNFCYNAYNYATNTGGAVYDPQALKNTSPNNTGITDLPAARPALIWYPYNATGTAFPIFGSGSTNTSMLGPMYNFDPALASPNKIPRYYDHHLFIFDFARTLIHAVRLDDTGSGASVERFWDQASANPINNPIDLKVGPDGAFYFLDWGDNGSYPANAGHGNLVKLDYTGPVDAVLPARVSRASSADPVWKVVGLDRLLDMPTGAVRAQAFDVRGREASWRPAPGSAAGRVRIATGVTGLLRVRISFVEKAP